MSGNHIPFDKLSDLYDDEMDSREEKASLMRHLESCKACSLEYKRLGKTLKLCRDVAAVHFPLEQMSRETIAKIKSSRKKRQFLKSMPAMAASILVIAGIGLFNAGIIGVHDSSDIAAGVSRRSYSESEKVIDIIRSHKAAIALVTDEYVEGTVPVNTFNDLRKSLGSRKVAYMLVEETGKDNGASWGGPIEQVGLEDGPIAVEGTGKKYVRFRVFR
ncbi:MAG: zf-HC2 domain-containing protein [Spirochaetes bacterium]|nr:zf-HC2 domain-containing protein [Spirochaetota bacterium]